MNKELPPPEQRLCRKHGRSIKPSSWRKGYRTTGCAECDRERARSPEVRERREKKYQKEFIPCARHPERMCNRSYYVANGVRRCGSCISRRSDGSYKTSLIKNRKKQHYKKIVIDRTKHYSNGMRGIELFNRSTGMNLAI